MAERRDPRTIVELAAEFERLRRRAVRQKKTIDVSYEAWER
jgi:hypothetical protein